MIIYIDENMPPKLAEGFQIIQQPLSQKQKDPIEVRSVKDDFGEGIPDEKWIPLAGKKGACIITQDYNIHRTRHQRSLCNKYKLGMFYFKPPSKNGFTYWNMVKLLVKHWEDITKKAIKEERPFSYRITSRGKMKRLD